MNSQETKECAALNNLLTKLEDHGGCVPLERLEQALENLDLPESFIDQTATFSAHQYQRKSLHRSVGFEVLLLCWEAGQRSPIHDHIGSSCAFKILRGTATETQFEMRPGGHIVAGGSTDLPKATVCASRDEDIHQISNIQADPSPLVTLHIYSPPLENMNTYSLLKSRYDKPNQAQTELLEGAGI